MCSHSHAFYKLKQSPLAWFTKFSQLIFVYDFVLHSAYPTIMWKTTLRGIIILAIYVDNNLLAGSDKSWISTFNIYFH